MNLSILSQPVGFGDRDEIGSYAAIQLCEGKMLLDNPTNYERFFILFYLDSLLDDVDCFFHLLV